MKTLPETSMNTQWHHYRTQPADMTSRVQQRLRMLEREERDRVLNREPDRVADIERPWVYHQTPKKPPQWPWVLLVGGIIGFVIYSLMTTPDWF